MRFLRNYRFNLFGIMLIFLLLKCNGVSNKHSFKPKCSKDSEKLDDRDAATCIIMYDISILYMYMYTYSENVVEVI